MTDFSFSLINLKGISKPLTKLIKSVSKGIGKIYEPTAKVRGAKAEAKAIAILAEAQIETDVITTRALERVKFKEIRRQRNIDSIVKGASVELPQIVSPEPVDEDWIVNFFDLCQDIGNTKMQQIWSKLLAGEVSRPGTFKPRTLHTVKSLTPEEALMFTTLCSFSFSKADGDFFLPTTYSIFPFIRDNGFSALAETHLKNIGLLSNSYIHHGDDDKDTIELNYLSETYTGQLYKKEEVDMYLLTYFPFTEIGNELASIAGAEPNSKYIKVLLDNENIYKQK